MDTIIQILARELSRSEAHMKNMVRLIDESNTIPFIARYHKEFHEAMDNTTLHTLADRLQYLCDLDKRRGEVEFATEGRGRLTEGLSTAIDVATTLAEVENLYRPYKQKRRTCATVAREEGLEPLAELLFAQAADGPTPGEAAGAFIDPRKGMETAENVLQKASNIIAEHISDDADTREHLRELVWKKGSLVSAVATKKPGDTVYRLHYAFRFPLNRVQGHQVLAINRGEREDVPKVSMEMECETALIPVRRTVLNPGAPAMAFVRAATEDAYDRLIFPSVEREIRSLLTEQASEGAIKMLGLSLKPLLVQPPTKGFVTTGLSPGYRNGCKVAVVNVTGRVLDATMVYPAFSQQKREEAIGALAKLIHRHGVAHIAIGDGIASRETEQMTVELIKQLGGGVSYVIVNEAGASVCSAFKLAVEEFPDYGVNLRGTVSVVRRFQDPLAELVKIDPKSIDVDQYQHDMPQARLDETLSGVMEDRVNAVGMDLNTAPVPLLSYVTGLSHTTARSIVKCQKESGAFTTRKGVLKMPKLGPKAFEQCAGFLRIPESHNVLDYTGVYSESYGAAGALLALYGYGLPDVKAGGLDSLRERVAAYGEEKAVEVCGVDIPTLRDIVDEPVRPDRDPRGELPRPILCTDVLKMKDLEPGMELTGAVRNVIGLGVFVDIGVHQDGLVHISRLQGGRRMQHLSKVCAMGDIVTIWVLEVDEKKKRIFPAMKKPKG